MKKVIFAALVALVVTSAFAEKAENENKAEVTGISISGNVVDRISGEALVGVEVKLEGSDRKAYTDFDGHFVISNVKAGDCKLVASYISYNKDKKALKLDSQTNHVEIKLQASK